jgi:hypothetical protein
LRSGFGNTFLVDLQGKKQLGFIDCDDLRFHCGGRLILTRQGSNAIVLRTTDLAIVASFAKAGSHFSLDPTGEYALTAEGQSVVVTKLSTKKEMARTTGLSMRGRLDLINPTTVLVNGQWYYDLKTGIPVWSYQAQGASTLLPNGQMLYVTSVDGQTMVAAATVPDTDGTNAVAKASPDQFVLSPGAHIAIVDADLPSFGNAQVAREQLEKLIKSAGHTVDPAGPYKLAASAAPGATGKFTVGVRNMMGPPAVKEYDAPSSNAKITLTRDGETIWQRNLTFKAEVMVQRQGNESIEEALARAGRPDAGRLAHLDLPGYLVKGSGKAGGVPTLGESELTRTGFVTKR